MSDTEPYIKISEKEFAIMMESGWGKSYSKSVCEPKLKNAILNNQPFLMSELIGNNEKIYINKFIRQNIGILRRTKIERIDSIVYSTSPEGRIAAWNLLEEITKDKKIINIKERYGPAILGELLKTGSHGKKKIQVK